MAAPNPSKKFSPFSGALDLAGVDIFEQLLKIVSRPERFQIATRGDSCCSFVSFFDGPA
jgi:hypothetical protein